MLNITKKQAIHRWDKLSMILREAIFSERNADILWGVCEDQHLPDDKIHKVASLVGDVLMGFTHPDDLTKEIKSELALNPIIIDSIVKEVNSKIFAPIRSEINKVLALPMLTEEEIEAEKTAGEEKPIVSDIVKGEVRYTKSEGVEAESIKIVGVGKEGKVMIPKGIEMAEGPVILQKEENFETVMGTKKSLGELFGFLGGGGEIKKEAPVAAKIEMGDLQPIILTELKEIKKTDKLKEILESKPEVNFPLDLLHIKPSAITNDLQPITIEKIKPIIETITRDSIENSESIKKIEKKINKEEIKVVHYTDLPVRTDIKISEAKPEAKPFEIKIASDIKPIQPEIKIETPKMELVKEEIKKPFKVVDFIGKILAVKKVEDIKLPKIEPIKKIEPPMPLIEPKKKKGFFSSLFNRKLKENKQQEEIKKPTEDKKEPAVIDEPVVKLVKEQDKK